MNKDEEDDVISVNAYSIKDYPSLPYSGWIKICTNHNCKYPITSNYIIYNYKDKKYKFYFCGSCINTTQYLKYIEKYYFYKL